ncbi:hypothetical protein [Mucilaginibacter sp.]|uniref:hypothetical protein n=1 Tax=Mucilaginibacter sp. TaxID=1882438 RepID=UPI002612C5C5|nr:hypothetical protein [Mucilaginibacter sp.]MDB4923285.1 outer membrane protein/protective antigen [Mucilaginibacter sp.]
MKTERDIELAIDKIVLHGFAPKDSKGLKEAVEFELGRLIKERGLPEVIKSGGNFEHLPGGNFSIKTGSSLKTLASKISNQVYNGFGESKTRK